MQVSVIIPTYNRRELLSQSLYYLSEQDRQDSFAIEIIVVDDGSTDGTCDLINDYKTRIDNLVYLFHQRIDSEPHCPSSIRNLGIQRSSGEIIVFLDCGVLVPPDFIGHVVEHYLALPDQVLVHYTVGLWAEMNEQNQQRLLNLSPKTLSQEMQKLIEDLEWIDIREALFDLADNQLNRLAAPWILGWSCAMSVPKQLVEKVGGFDESFQGWGAEDIDLGYRLYQLGTSFTATRDCMVLHLPHKRQSLTKLFATDDYNHKKLHEKTYRLDTELAYYYPGPYYNQVLAHYEHLALSYVTPSYSSDLLMSINIRLLNAVTPSLLIGCDSHFTAKHLATTHNFVHNLAIFNKFCQYFPEREIQYLLGCNTPYTDKYFKVIVLTDFVRLLPKILQSELFKELHRIGQEVFCLYTSYYIPTSRHIDGSPWSSLNEIKQVLEALQLRLAFFDNIHGTSVFKLQM